uniref:Putative PD-(D/E)XK nuclease superfamily protein n=1 Tax=viral metagenome TaxID=1070528 RepID=A0A6H2A0I4_9ZZZZ
MADRELHYLYDKKICIAFYPNSHRYKREGRNCYEIGVTSITGQLDKPGLIYWATGLARDYLLDRLDQGLPIDRESISYASGIHKEVKEKSATLGSAVHLWIEQWTKGENPPIPQHPFDEFTEEEVGKIVSGIMAFLKWVQDHNVKILHAEKLVYSMKHGFVGTLDAIAEVDGKKCLIDYKTSKGIYTEMRYQTVAYKKAYEEETGQIIHGGRWIIRLDKETGDFQAVFLPVSDDEPDYKAFLGLLEVKQRSKQLYEWEKQVKLNS